ncbi:hypothetical protein D3C84_455540 [compost metagenome]
MGIGFEQSDLGLDGPCAYGYEQSYLVSALDAIGSRLDCAVSAAVPLGRDSWRSKQAPAFLYPRVALRDLPQRLNKWGGI